MVRVPSEGHMIRVAPGTAKRMTFEEAALYCQFLEHDGYRNWRIPTEEEYYEIVVPFLKETMDGYVWGWFIGRNKHWASKEWNVYPVRDDDNVST